MQQFSGIFVVLLFSTDMWELKAKEEGDPYERTEGIHMTVINGGVYLFGTVCAAFLVDSNHIYFSLYFLSFS
jgi:hypothetical protein